MGIREEFEKLPEIAEIIVREKAVFIGDGYRIRGNDQAESYLDGAWYAFQEQQKRIDRLKKYLIDSCAFDDDYIEEILK